MVIMKGMLGFIGIILLGIALLSIYATTKVPILVALLPAGLAQLLPLLFAGGFFLAAYSFTRNWLIAILATAVIMLMLMVWGVI